MIIGSMYLPPLDWKLSTKELMLLNCGAGEDSWESFGLQEDPPSPSSRRSVLNIHWKDWCWSCNSSSWPSDVKKWLIGKDPDVGKDWRWDEKGSTRWNGWMASPMWWTWVWVNSGSCWWTGRPGMLQSMGSQRVRHDWVTELSWTETKSLGNAVTLVYIFSYYVSVA